MVASADFKVVEIMRRGDLDGAGALFGIRIVIADDRNAPADQRQYRDLADQMFVPLIGGMHRHGGIAEHRFGTRCRDHD